MVDARLQDGSRVNAIIPPLALDGPVLSIRRFRTDRLGAQDLVARESVTPPMLDFLRAAVACRLNVIISGGTGAGKTTMLNMLSAFISDKERIVTIEDAAELMLRQRHVVRLETRPANIEGQGAIKQRQLVINALRMRPDRIVVGEVRGDEALDMLQAMNTGHDGSLTTVHANSPRDALYRLDTMVAMANLNIPERAVRQQIASAINLIIQVTRLTDGTRRVTAISEVTGMEQDVITMQDIFLFERTGLTPEGKVTGRFKATGIRPKCSAQLQSSGYPLADGHVRARARDRVDGGIVQLIALGTFVGILVLFWGLYWLVIVRDEDHAEAHLSKRLKAAIGKASSRHVGLLAKVEQQASNIGVLNRLLTGSAFTGPIERLLTQADSRLTVGLFMLMSAHFRARRLLGGDGPHHLSRHRAGVLASSRRCSRTCSCPGSAAAGFRSSRRSSPKRSISSRGRCVPATPSRPV